MSNIFFHQRIYFFIIFYLTLGSTFALLAQTGELRRPVQGIRNLGMGNAGIALSFDENALFYNPAGLASVDTILVGFPILNEVIINGNDKQSTKKILNEINLLTIN